MTVLTASVGIIYVAPADTVQLPLSALEPLDALFVDVGFISEDGLHQTDTPLVRGRRHWNSLSPNLQLPAGYDTRFEFTPLDYTETVTVLQYAGGAWADIGDGTRVYEPPTRTAPYPILAFVADMDDGIRRIRKVIDSAVVTSAVDRTYSADLTSSPIVLALVGDGPGWREYDSLVL